jgi:beta-N-acetylhexosaminidase
MKSVIFGLEGLELKQEEKDFFKVQQPLGFILFARNIKDPQQVRSLVEDLKSCVEHDYVPILIDQEGGRVRRLKPPFFREAKAAKIYANLAESNLEAAKQMTFLNHYLMGKELIDLGINTNCAPVADLLFDGAHEIVSDRSFGKDPQQVIELCRAAALGLQAAGVTSIIKHIPGHGRAKVDSHFDLPKVNTSLSELEKTDFLPFKELSNIPIAMTAHMIFDALDPNLPVTLSSNAVHYIREKIGFKNILLTDDLSMKALTGSFTEKVNQAQDAGCDVMLHCNGIMEEMKEIAAATNKAPTWILELLENQTCPPLEKSFNHLMNATESDLIDGLKEAASV